MGEVKISNLVKAVLSDSGGVDAADTTINVSMVVGSFPALGAGDWFRLVLIRASDLAKEFVKVTAVSGSGPYALTVDRAEEGSTALDLVQGDAAELRFTAETFEDYKDQLQALVDAANSAASTALAAAENASTLATNALSVANAVTPVSAADIDDNAVTESKIHPDVAGTGLDGGGGTPLSIKIASDYLEHDGSGDLTLKTGALVESLWTGGTPVRAGELTIGDTTNSRIYKGTPGSTKRFGPMAGSKGAMVYLGLKNAGTGSDFAFGNIRIGSSLAYFTTGFGDSGITIQPFSIQAGNNEILPISFFLPPNWYYCIEIVTADSVANTIEFASEGHRYQPFK